MAHALAVAVDERVCRVDGRDVADWAGARAQPDPADAVWQERAADYVRAHPRPSSGNAGVAAAQRLALLRRLAAGPADRRAQLRALREAGWVGAADLENRLRELRGDDARTAGGGVAAAARLALGADGGRVWLREPFPRLDPAQQRALAFAKIMVGRLDSPLAAAAMSALDALLPGVTAASGGGDASPSQAAPADLERFHAAFVERRAVRIRYFSLNSGMERSYDVVPVEYVALGASLKAVCVEVDEAGRRGEERQLALDRLRAAEPLDRPPLAPAELELARTPTILDVSEGLYEVMRERNLFGIPDAEAEPDEHELGIWRVRGSFPTALSWDVMEQLCAWAGNVQVHEPYWLVNAVCRRLRAGLKVMEEGGAFELVKPEPRRLFASHEEAIASEPEERDGRARRISPRRPTPRR